MERHGSALPFVADIDSQAENVAQLALEGGKISVDHFVGITCARPSDGPVETGLRLLLFDAGLGLADREPLGDDLLSHSFGIFSGRYGARVAHRDIAFQ